jgi:hypothetical protein
MEFTEFGAMERVSGGWATRGGNPDQPQTVIIGDMNLKTASKDPTTFELKERDQVVSIWGGTLKEAQDFFGHPKPYTLRNVKNIVFLGYGTDMLCKEGPLGGPKWIPGTSIRELGDQFDAIIDDLHKTYPNAVVITSDPIPHQTTPTHFANARIKCFSYNIAPRFEKHHHICLNRRYVNRKTNSLKKEFFNDDELIAGEVKTLIKSTYEAIDIFEAGPDSNADKYLGAMGLAIIF